MRGVRSRVLLLTLLLLAAVPALDLGAAAIRFGPAYVPTSLDSTASGFEKMESGINARPIDFLKLGALVLRDGVTQTGARLLPPSWIAQASAPTPHVVGFSIRGRRVLRAALVGLHPHRRAPGRVFPDGIFGQVLYVSRATGIVALRTGDGEAGVDWPRVLRALTDVLSTQLAD